MKTFRIALYPGDGIGIDVTDEAVRVLRHLERKVGGFALEMETFPWGMAYYEEHGQVAPDDYLDQLRPFDAIYLGALGWPERLPDHITLAPLVGIRQSFDQYACLRPAKLRPGVRCPLAKPGKIDMAVVRENSEGEYVVCGGRTRTGRAEEVAVQTAIHTRHGVERVLRFGFDLARKRRRKLTMITKSNAQRFGFVLWDETLDAIAPEFPDVAVDKQHVDRASMNFVQCPDSFDVIVASNLFGDILTDLSGAVVGSLGLNPSANLNPERRFPSMFEPVHGTAPDIAGQGIANPTAAILSAGMMLDWLGLREAGAVIEPAVDAALSAGQATPDLGGKLTTAEMTDRVIERL